MACARPSGRIGNESGVRVERRFIVRRIPDPSCTSAFQTGAASGFRAIVRKLLQVSKGGGAVGIVADHIADATVAALLVKRARPVVVCPHLESQGKATPVT